MNFLFFGELMLRLTPARDGERLAFTGDLSMTPGGSEANSAVSLKSLGRHHAVFLSSFPDNPLGENCLQKLRAIGVKVISLPSNADRMGLYWLDMGRGPRASKVYYDRANSAFDGIDAQAIGARDIQCDWFHTSGVTPAISERSCRALFRILEILPTEVPFSMDLNFRSKLWQWADHEEMMSVYRKLCRRTVLLTGNETDFQTCLGVRAEGDSPRQVYQSIASSVFSEYSNLRFLAVSLRDAHSSTRNTWSGILFVRSGESVHSFSGPSMQIDSIVDRLGTGDSFTAGILHGLASFEEDYQKTIDFAVVLSAIKHTIYGDFSCFTEEEVFEVLNGLGRSVINR